MTLVSVGQLATLWLQLQPNFTAVQLGETDTAGHAGCDWFHSHVALLQCKVEVDIKTLKLVFEENVTFEMCFSAFWLL
jgi:hypothetical protein